jgi:hypothetical protein
MRILFIFVLFIVHACANKRKISNQIETKVPYSEISDSIISKIIFSENKLDSSNLRIAYQYYRKPQFSWQDSVNYKISSIILNKMHDNEVNVEFEQLDHTFFKQQMELFYSEALSEYNKMKYKALWQFDMQFRIHSIFNEAVSLEVLTKSFFGNSQSVENHEFFHFSKQNGTQLYINDIYHVDSSFLQLIQANFNKQNELNPKVDYSEFGFWFENNTFQLSTNFEINKDSLIFIYNPYEIAPYSFGKIKVSVPFTLTIPYFKINLSKN